MSKDISGFDLLTPASLFVFTPDDIAFEHHFIQMYEQAIDQRVYISRSQADLHKITVSPEGVAYPGDATPGTGPKQVTIQFTVAIATVVHTLVDHVDFSTGWVILTKGNHLVVYNDTVVHTVTVEPS